MADFGGFILNAFEAVFLEDSNHLVSFPRYKSKPLKPI